jgi:hypothetical protein
MHFVKVIIEFLMIITLIGACELHDPQLRKDRAPPEKPLVWPQSPQRPRIRFVQAISQPRDLGIQPSFWKRLGELLVGREEQWFIRPTGLAARGKMIYVADPGAQAMWIIDFTAKRFNRIGKAGSQPLISPVSITLGRDEKVYLADSYAAKVFVFNGIGAWKATLSTSKFKRPAGLAFDAARDRLYVADSANHLVWVLTGSGKLKATIGQRGKGDGEFNFPSHVWVDRTGTIYVTDSLGFRVQFFSPEGTFIGKLGKHGDASGDFAMPKGIAVDSEGHLYVVDALFDAVQIFEAGGRYLLTFGDRGVGLGQFWLPGGLFIDGDDRIYVADAYNQRIQIFEYLRNVNNP